MDVGQLMFECGGSSAFYHNAAESRFRAVLPTARIRWITNCCEIRMFPPANMS